MSKIGTEVLSLSSDDMGVPKQFKGHMEDGVYIPSPEEEKEIYEAQRLAALKDYTTEELEEELDSRITSTADVEAAQARRKK